jgi:hypothetical protein
LGISPTNTPSQNRENLIRALSNSGQSITFPAGDYLVDNSGTYAVISGFAGTLAMETGARFVFTDNTRRGLIFRGGSGATFQGLRSTFTVRPPSRVNAQECLLFVETSDVAVRQAEIDGSAAAGLLFSKCVRPSVNGARIRNTMADGLHFANCQDPRADDVLVENTGDDGLAFLNYASGPAYTGGLATGITVNGSRSRGIAVVGQRGVTVRNFSVNRTASSGLYCAQEDSYDTRVPYGVLFEGGRVENAGRIDEPRGHKNGITYSNIGSVTFNDITVSYPAARGVSGIAPGGVVKMTGVRVRNAPGSGFNLQKGTYKLYDLVAQETGQTGVYVAWSKSVTYGTLTSRNTSKSSSLRRAFSFENNQRVVGSRLNVVDSAPTPTGYKINGYGTGDDRLGGIYDRIQNGEIRLENVSGLSYRLR